jgi:plastocyanin
VDPNRVGDVSNQARPLALAVCAATLAVLLASCGGSSGSPPGSAPGSPTATSAARGAAGGITISGFAYSGTMTVKPGQKVTVTNDDSVTHTLTDKVSHKFDTGDIPGSGRRKTFTAPTQPGRYPFGCTIHPDMKGTLLVRR